MPPWHASLCLSLTFTWLHRSQGGCLYAKSNQSKEQIKSGIHSSAGDFSGFSPEDSWEWPDSRGTPTTIRLPDGREFWPSDSRDVVHPRELGWEPVDARWQAKFYKRLWDEYRDYEEKNATRGRRMKAIDCHYDLLKNTDLSIAAKAEQFAQEAGSIFEAEKRNQSGEGISERPGDLEKLSNIMLKALKLHKKWYGKWYTDQPYKPRGFTTFNWDVNDFYSRYYAGIKISTRANSLEDKIWEDAFFRTMTEYTTFLPMDAEWWIKAAEYSEKYPNISTDRDYLQEAVDAWATFTHPTTEHVSHRTINLTVFFNRHYTKNDTFDYFSLDQFKPKGWTTCDPFEDPKEVNRYELKRDVIARCRNQTTQKIPRANFFYSLYESEYDCNNTYSELEGMDFGHFQGKSSEVESVREEPKTYPPHVPTCPHGFPKDSNYDPDDDVSIYEDMQVHTTTEYPTTGIITHEVGFQYNLVSLGTTMTVDMDVLLGRNTWPTKRTSTTTRMTRRSRRPGTRASRARKETCHHGLEITNDHHDTKALRNVFERIRHNETVNSGHTYRKRSTQFRPPKGNVTRTRKTRSPKTMSVKHDLKKREVEDGGPSLCGKGLGKGFEHSVVKRDVQSQEVFTSKMNSPDPKGQPLGIKEAAHPMEKRSVHPIGRKLVDDKVNSDAQVLGRLKSVIDIDHRRRKRAAPAADLEEHFAAKPLSEGLLPAGQRGNRRKRQFSALQGSHAEYFSKAAKEKAYRSYEDYLKKTKNECGEEKICRLFKEELARQDSFDGINEHW